MTLLPRILVSIRNVLIGKFPKWLNTSFGIGWGNRIEYPSINIFNQKICLPPQIGWVNQSDKRENKQIYLFTQTLPPI